MGKGLKQTKEEIAKREAEAGKLLEKVEKAKEKLTEFPEEFRQMILQTIDWTFNVIAKREGDHWKLQPDELHSLGNSYVALAEKYLPEGLSRFSAEINAFLWTAIIVSKRIILKNE